MSRLSPAVAGVAETHDLLAPARVRLRARDAEIVRQQVELAEIPAPTEIALNRSEWRVVRNAEM